MAWFFVAFFPVQCVVAKVDADAHRSLGEKYVESCVLLQCVLVMYVTLILCYSKAATNMFYVPAADLDFLQLKFTQLIGCFIGCQIRPRCKMWHVVLYTGAE